MKIKKRFKIILILMLSLLFVAALTACAKGSDREYNVSYVVRQDDADADILFATAVATETTSLIETAPQSIRPNYALVGWFFDEERTRKAEFPLKVHSELLLYAKWVKVYSLTYKTYHEGESGESVTYGEMETYNLGEQIRPVEPPFEDGYTFMGWNWGGQNPAVMPDGMPAQNLTVLGMFRPNTYKICFDIFSDRAGTYNLSGTTTTHVATYNGMLRTFPAIEVTYGKSFNTLLDAVVAQKDDFDFDCWTRTVDGARKDFLYVDEMPYYSEARHILLTPKWAQYGTAGLEFTLNEDETEYTVTRYTRNNARVLVPATYKGKPVTAIGDGAFMPRGATSELTVVQIPYTVTSIARNAFMNCAKLTEIRFSDATGASTNDMNTTNNRIAYVGESAFRGCVLLTHITLHSGSSAVPRLREIAEYAFSDCESLVSVTVTGTGLQRIGAGAFTNGKALETVILPNSLEWLGNFAFQNCTALLLLDLEKTRLQVLGAGVFIGCTALKTVNIPATVTKIGQKAFEGCTELTSVNVPAAIKTVEARAFYGCRSLVNIMLTTNITVIQANAFYGCTSLVNGIVQGVGQAEDYPLTWEADWDLLNAEGDRVPWRKLS